MSTIHIRVGISSGEFSHHVQLSTDNLLWFTVRSFKRPADAMTHARELELKFRDEWKIKIESVLWRTKQ